MSARVFRLAIWVLLAAPLGCTTMPDGVVASGAPRSSRNPWAEDRNRDRYGPRATIVPVPEGASPESLRWAVEAALSERHWTVDSTTPGRIQASVESHGTREAATIAVTYGPGSIQIKQLAASVNPQRYDRWVRLLVTNINKHVGEIVMGQRGAPVAVPPPAAASPPVAAPSPVADPDDP